MVGDGGNDAGDGDDDGDDAGDVAGDDELQEFFFVLFLSSLETRPSTRAPGETRVLAYINMMMMMMMIVIGETKHHKNHQICQIHHNYHYDH